MLHLMYHLVIHPVLKQNLLKFQVLFRERFTKFQLYSLNCAFREFLSIHVCHRTAESACLTRRRPRNAFCDACFRCGPRALQKRGSRTSASLWNIERGNKFELLAGCAISPFSSPFKYQTDTFHVRIAPDGGIFAGKLNLHFYIYSKQMRRTNLSLSLSLSIFIDFLPAWIEGKRQVVIASRTTCLSLS